VPGSLVADQEGLLVDANKPEVALLFVEQEKAMIPINTRAFTISQQSVRRLNSIYSGALVVYRNGLVDVIERIEQEGFYGDTLLKKMQSVFLGTHYVKVYFKKSCLSLEQLKQLVAEYLPTDAERGAPYLPLSQPLNSVLAAVRAATSQERVLDALHLPGLEDCLDGL